MKKILILLFFAFTLVSCGKTEEVNINNNVSGKIEKCNSPFTVGKIDKSSLKLKGVIINDDLKTISSPMAGVVKVLNCNAGKKVYSNTLIARINPDFNNPNIINLSIQKGSLVNQKTNLESIKKSTLSSFDSQISNLKEQIKINEKNIELTKKSSSLNKNDLGKQIESLKSTLLTLKSNLELAKKAKKESLEKININRLNLLTNIKSISGDNLLKIDQIFGITNDNRRLNDKYEDYLSGKKTNLGREVKIKFLKLNDTFNKIDNLSDIEISNFLGDLISLDNLSKEAIKNSIANIYFPQTQIDNLYSIFLNYSNNLSTIKRNWDSIENSKSSINTSFDTQISSLQNQIKTSNNNLDNLETNKLNGVDVGLDLQVSNLNSGLKTLNSNLKNLLSTKKSQILGLDNQILQLNQNINSLNTKLSARNIYSGISGTVKQKNISVGNNVGINTPLCQIIPNKSSTKIKIYSPVELNIGDKLNFNFNNKLYKVQIKNVLVYKDKVTQNYIYESNYLNKSGFKDGEILSLSFEQKNTTLKNKNLKQNNKKIKIPVSYIENKIDGNFLKINSNSGVIEKEVKLGDINGDFIEVKKGLEGVNKICK